MPIYTNNNQGNTPGNNSLAGFSSFRSMPSFNNPSTTDLTPAELLSIAKSSGGAIGQVASELTNPHTSILSTIDQGFKDAFHGFINTISLTGETVAGTIDSLNNGTNLKDSIKNAIDTKKRISDAIFGSKTIDFNGDGNKTTMEKVGDFIVRTPFDILLDPLTYLTFGASAGSTFLERAGLSLASNSKVSLTKNVAEHFGIKLGEGEVVSKSLNDLGQQVFGYTKKIVAQKTGKIAADNMIAHGIETGALKQSLIDQGVSKDIIDIVENTAKGVVNQNRKNIELGLLKNNVDLTGKELSILVKNTMELPVNMDLAKKTISSLLDSNPALGKTIIDQGGIKYFGKTLLSAQRISQIKSMIPGMTKLDELTLPLRNSLLAPFDTGLKKINGVYTRIPEEFAKVQQGFKDLTQARKVDFANNMQNIKDVYKLNSNDVNILMDAVHTSKMPADVRLGKAYSDLTGILEKDRQMFESLGIPKSKLDMYTGNVLLTNNEGKIARNGNFRQVPGTAEHASYAKLIEQSSLPTLSTNTKIAEELKNLIPNKFNDLATIKSPQELASSVGKYIDTVVNDLTSKGSSFADAMKNDKVQSLVNIRNKIDELTKNSEVIGKLENLGYTKQEAGDLTGYWTDNQGRIFNRVAATASQLADAGMEGFDTNLLTSFVFRGMKNISQLTAHEFMGSMIRDFGKWANEAPPSWVTLSSTAIDEKTKFLAKQLFNDAGQEMKFHPAIAEAVDGMMKGMVQGDEITSKVFENYDKILKYWKASMTSIFPMFHGRNAISNVFQNFLDLGAQALNPATHFSALNLMADNSNMNKLIEKSMGVGEEAVKASQDLNTLLNKTVFKDNSGYNWTFGELQKIVKDNNIAFNKNNLGYMDIADREKLLTNLFEKETKYGQAKNIAKTILPIDTEKFFGYKAGKWLGGGIEDQARLVNFMTNLKATGDVAHSAARTKMFLFDYGNLTSFERSFMRRVIPFYTWTRKNLELQYKTFTSQPGRVAAEVKTIMNFGSVFDGQQLTEAEQKLVPEWLKNSLNLKVKNKTGADQLLSGFSTPVEQAFQQFTSNQILGGISPLIRFPLEKMTGYQFFRGKPTSQVIDASNYKYAPQALKDFIGYSEYRGVTKAGKKYDVSVSLRPERMMTLQNLPFSRVITTLGNITDQTKTVGMKTLEGMTGVKTMSFNEQLLEQKQQDTLRVALENVLTNAGVRGQFIRYYTKKNTTQLQ